MNPRDEPRNLASYVTLGPAYSVQSRRMRCALRPSDVERRFASQGIRPARCDEGSRRAWSYHRSLRNLSPRCRARTPMLVVPDRANPCALVSPVRGSLRVSPCPGGRAGVTMAVHLQLGGDGRPADSLSLQAASNAPPATSAASMAAVFMAVGPSHAWAGSASADRRCCSKRVCPC
jgi:hypothetical protein